MKNLYPFLQRSGEFYEIKQIFFLIKKLNLNLKIKKVIQKLRQNEKIKKTNIKNNYLFKLIYYRTKNPIAKEDSFQK